MISRREWLRITAGGMAFGVAGASRLLASAPAKEATVYKSATCGCCKKWVEHLQAAGYKVTSHDVPDVNVYKKKYGVPDNLGSCHTAVVSSGYVVEGHVPADLIDRLVAQRPKDIVGLAVPGMPQGSPGMETGVVDKYEIIAFDKAGKTRVFARRG
ncbi:MAG TPA: DUF411 domain-containing protein [Gemmatimonadaceae bacterium]|jgi:hypothetical protein|nr:DUF411 domain-containing protein [Gemmatimonadaceae bacterium]